MKKIRITTTFTVDDDFYSKEAEELKEKILSGRFQREMVSEYKRDKSRGKIIYCKATFEDLITTK